MLDTMRWQASYAYSVAPRKSNENAEATLHVPLPLLPHATTCPRPAAASLSHIRQTVLLPPPKPHVGALLYSGRAKTSLKPAL